MTDDVFPDPRRWIALAVCCSALFMTLLDVSITNVALPSIGTSTGASPAMLQWVVSGYTLSFGLVPVLAGRLGDDYGRRTMFLVGVGGFVATSILSGIAPGPGLLVAARVLQGLSGGLINPQVSGIVQQLFRGAERGKAFGAIGAVVGLGTALGPVVGGLLIAAGGDEYGWRLVFFINLPLGIAVILLARKWVPATGSAGRHRLDIAGAILLGLATFCVLFAAVEYDAVHNLALAWLLVPCAVFLAIFIRRESLLTQRKADPLVDLRLFKQPSYTAGVVLAVVFFCSMTGIPLVLALYYQQGLGYSALQSGLGVTAAAAGAALMAPLAGRFVSRVGRPLVVGACLVFGLGATAMFFLMRGTPESDVALLLAIPLFITGLGQGGVITPNQTLTLSNVDPAIGSTAGGVLQTSQRIGSAIGQAVIGAAFFAAVPAGVGALHGTAKHAVYSDAFAQAILVSLIFVAAALVVGLVDLANGRRARLAHS